MSCPLCKREKLTEWYYEDDSIWVVVDRNPKGYAKRILGVWKPHGLPPRWDEFMPTMARMMSLMMRFAVNEGWKTFTWDDGVSIGDHWHIQLCCGY